ncbi:MAG: hypothetical protein H0U73_09445 [Tatlockia sp.]|nr:hypothetical protein [Tatlockia sp.]
MIDRVPGTNKELVVSSITIGVAKLISKTITQPRGKDELLSIKFFCITTEKKFIKDKKAKMNTGRVNFQSAITSCRKER